jgi:hypothetical protein
MAKDFGRDVSRHLIEFPLCKSALVAVFTPMFCFARLRVVKRLVRYVTILAPGECVRQVKHKGSLSTDIAFASRGLI